MSSEVQLELDTFDADELKEDVNERLHATVEDFANQSVTQENYDRFVDQVDTVVKQIDQVIFDIQSRRKRSLKKKSSFKKPNEDRIDQIEEQYLAGLEVTPKKLRDYAEELRDHENYEKLWAHYKAEIQRVKAAKLKQVIDSIDVMDVQVKHYEKMDEIFKERAENIKDTTEDKVERLESDVEKFKEKERQKNIDFRNSVREDRRHDREVLMETLQESVDALAKISENGIGDFDVDSLRNKLTSLESSNSGSSDDTPKSGTGQTGSNGSSNTGSENGAETESSPSAEPANTGTASTPEAGNDSPPEYGPVEPGDKIYELKEKPLEEKKEVVEQMRHELGTAKLAEMSKRGITELLDVSYPAFYGKEKGDLPRIEAEFGVEYPEFQSSD